MSGMGSREGAKARSAQSPEYLAMVEIETKAIVDDMAFHVGDQIFELLKRNGMLMRSSLGVVAMLTHVSVLILQQADSFMVNSLAEDEGSACSDDIAQGRSLMMGAFAQMLPDELRAFAASRETKI